MEKHQKPGGWVGNPRALSAQRVREKFSPQSASAAATGPRLAVVCDAADLEVAAWARELAQRLDLSLCAADATGAADWLLEWNDDGQLGLRDARDPKIGPVAVDFAAELARPFAALSRRQPLAKALGKRAHTAVDVTAGLGHDSYLIASLGLGVLAIERSPVVFALLADGLRRLRAHDPKSACIAARIRLAAGDARTLLATVAAPDVIYMDPMFPPKPNRSALAKKEVRMLRAIVGDDPDAAELLQVCRENALRRVVVKRPDYAPPVAPDVTVTYKGKLVRYDVYVRHAQT